MSKLHVLTKMGVDLSYEAMESYETLRIDMSGGEEEFRGRFNNRDAYIEFTDPKTNKKKSLQKRYVFLIEE